MEKDREKAYLLLSKLKVRRRNFLSDLKLMMIDALRQKYAI